MIAIAKLRSAQHAFASSLQVFLKDVGNGLLEVGHNSLALVGLMVLGGALFAASHPELRESAEREALGWLKARQVAREPAPEPEIVPAEPQAVERATAADPRSLNRQQAAVASWISRRYKVAPEPISRLVQEAWKVGASAGLDPTLILAIMAIESSYNPFAQSPVGAQGLMQVMTNIHDDKYQAFGGTRAAFDPVTNLRVGVLVLRECIQRAGSLEAGLKYYVGAANLPDDGGYAAKVLAEQDYLKRVAQGKPVAFNAPILVARASSGAPAAPTEGARPLSSQPAAAGTPALQPPAAPVPADGPQVDTQAQPGGTATQARHAPAQRPTERLALLD